MEVSLLGKMGACLLRAITIGHNPFRINMENDSVYLMSYTASFPWNTGPAELLSLPLSFWNGRVLGQHLGELVVARQLMADQGEISAEVWISLSGHLPTPPFCALLVGLQEKKLQASNILAILQITWLRISMLYRYWFIFKVGMWMGSHIFTSTAHVRYGEREYNNFPVTEKHVKLKTLFRLAGGLSSGLTEILGVIYSCTSRHQWLLSRPGSGQNVMESIAWNAL